MVTVDAQRWKSVFLIKRLNMTLVAPMSQPHEISPYRFLYDDCRFQPKVAGRGTQTPQEQKVFLTDALAKVGITDQNFEVLFAAPRRQPCPYICIAFLPRGIARPRLRRRLRRRLHRRLHRRLRRRATK